MAEAHEHAEAALAGLVNMMDDKLSPELKRAVYNDVMDRVWGKPKQSVDVGGGVRLVVDL